MKRLLVAMMILAVLSTAAAGAYAAPLAPATSKAAPYEGSFQGSVYGDGQSRAPLALDLTQRGNLVTGKVSLGEGLFVDGGFCGAVNVPATEQYAEGQTVRGNPRRLVVSPVFDVDGFDLAVDFESTVSLSGNMITAKAKVDLPWFCGRDPQLIGIVYRQ
jgi:hypothetical protein